MTRRNAAVLCALLACSFPLRAYAQSAPETPDGSDASEDKTVDEARRHFDRGLELYDEASFDAALAEMERAYQLAPNYRIRYNLGRIHKKLNHYAEALDAFERYLAEGGENLPTSRRDEVREVISSLKSRVATLELKTNVEAADFAIDDIPVGKSPISTSVIVNPGKRKVTVTKAGYFPASTLITVVGSDALVVKLDLVSVSGTPERTPAQTPRDNAGPRVRAYVGWATTGVLAASATVFGILSLNAQSRLKSDRESRNDVNNSLPATLTSGKERVQTLSLVTDVLSGAAVVAAGVSVYLTVLAVKADNTKTNARSSNMHVGIGPTSIRLVGRF